jgi:hypothetical protein
LRTRGEAGVPAEARDTLETDDTRACSNRAAHCCFAWKRKHFELETIERWEQLVEYLCLGLYRDLGRVVEAISNRGTSAERRGAMVERLCGEGRLEATLTVADAAAPRRIEADLRGRMVHTSVELAAPRDVPAAGLSRSLAHPSAPQRRRTGRGRPLPAQPTDLRWAGRGHGATGSTRARGGHEAATPRLPSRARPRMARPSR